MFLILFESLFLGLISSFPSLWALWLHPFIQLSNIEGNLLILPFFLLLLINRLIYFASLKLNTAKDLMLLKYAYVSRNSFNRKEKEVSWKTLLGENCCMNVKFFTINFENAALISPQKMEIMLLWILPHYQMP